MTREMRTRNSSTGLANHGPPVNKKLVESAPLVSSTLQSARQRQSYDAILGIQMLLNYIDWHCKDRSSYLALGIGFHIISYISRHTYIHIFMPAFILHFFILIIMAICSYTSIAISYTKWWLSSSLQTLGQASAGNMYLYSALGLRARIIARWAPP